MPLFYPRGYPFLSVRMDACMWSGVGCVCVRDVGGCMGEKGARLFRGSEGYRVLAASLCGSDAGDLVGIYAPGPRRYVHE